MSAPFDEFSSAPIDLSAFEESYARASTARAEAPAATVPDGVYDARIEEARLTRTPRTGNPMVVWRLRILGPTHHGATLTKNRIITEKTLAFLKEDLELIGIELDRLSDLEVHLERSVDRELRIVKKTGNTGWNDIYFARPAAHAASACANSASLTDDDTLPF